MRDLDASAVNDITDISHTVSGGSDYDAVAVPAVSAMVTERDEVGVTVVAAANLQVYEDGRTPDGTAAPASVFYTLVLNSRPVDATGGDTTVVITRTATALPGASVSIPALTFTSAQWNVAQTASVTALSDSDADDGFVRIVHVASGGDYSPSPGIEQVNVFVNDDDARAIVLVSADPLVVREDESATFTVALSAPSSDVVTVASAVTPAGGELTLTPATLTFAVADWNVPQTVTATAGGDADTTNDPFSIRLSATGGDYIGAGVTATLSGFIRDNDAPGVSVVPSALTLVESGAPAHYTLRLDADPGGEVTVVARLADAGGGALEAVSLANATLIFSAANWREIQSVTVAAGEDDADTSDDSATISHTVTGAGNYAGIDVDDVTLLITDDDVPGVAFTPPALTVAEAATAGAGVAGVYAVVLTSEPLGGDDVTVEAQSADTGAVRIEGAAALTFTAANWDSAQTFSVVGVADIDAGNERVRITHTARGANYEGYTPPEVVVTVTDAQTDTAPMFAAGADGRVDAQRYIIGTGATLTLPEASGGNGALSYTLAPLAALRGLAFDAGERTLSGTPQGPPAVATLTYTATDSDGNEGDDDTAALTFTVTVEAAPALVVSTATLSVAEEGGGNYTVRLASNPRGVVTVSQSATLSSVTFAGGASTHSIEFTPSDWNEAQTVSVFAAEDGNSGDESGFINLTSDSASADYDGLTARIDLEIGDADTNVVTTFASPPGGRTVAYIGEAFTLTLSDATGNGDIIYALTPSGDIPNGLSFDADTRILAGTPDTLTAGQGVQLTYTATDADSEVASAEFVLAVNVRPAVTITPPSLSVTEGATATYTVRLSTDPDAAVTVTATVSSSDLELSLSRLIFLGGTSGDWQTPQTVTVTALEEDPDYMDSSETITHRVSGYGTVTAPALVVAIDDNDLPPDIAPMFADGASVDDRLYLIGVPATLTLPEATGGNDTLSYTLAPLAALPGLAFDAGERVLSGTPEGPAAVATLTYTVTDADDNEDSADTAALTFTVTVEAAPALVVSTSALSVMETGNGDYTVRLASNPRGVVSVSQFATLPAITFAGGADVVAHTIEFTPSDWNEPQTVSVFAAPDGNSGDESGFINLTSDSALAVYDALTAQIALDIGDTDADVFPTFAQPVAGAMTYFVDEPFSLTLPLATGNGDITYDLQRSGDFPPGAVFSAQTRVLSGTPSGIAAAAELTYTATDEDGDVGILRFSVTVDVIFADIVLTPAALTVDEGGSATYTVRLKLELPDDGTVQVTQTLPAGLTFSGGSDGGGGVLTFTDADWNVAQTVTVTAAADDDLVDAPASVTFTPANLGGVPEFDRPDARAFAPFAVLIRDTDEGSLVFDPAAVEVQEGEDAIYSVQLGKQPAEGTVTVMPLSDNPAAEARPAALHFTAGDWNVAQSVTLVSVSTDADGRNESLTIRHTVTASDASGYAGVSGDVPATIIDRDERTLVFAPPTLTVREGESAAYTVALNTPPLGDVTVRADSAPMNLVTTEPDTLIFSANNWAAPQEVTVSAAEDDADMMNDAFTITHTASGFDYDDVETLLNGEVRDNEVPGVTVAPDALTLAESGAPPPTRCASTPTPAPIW